MLYDGGVKNERDRRSNIKFIHAVRPIRGVQRRHLAHSALARHNAHSVVARAQWRFTTANIGCSPTSETRSYRLTTQVITMSKLLQFAMRLRLSAAVAGMLSVCSAAASVQKYRTTDSRGCYSVEMFRDRARKISEIPTEQN